MNAKLLIAVFTCVMIANSSVFAMQDDNEIPSYISVKKSEVVKAWNSDKKINANGRSYTLNGYIGGTFGNNFLVVGENDDSEITFSSLSYPPVKGEFKYMDQMAGINPETQELEGIDGSVNIELK